MINPSGMFWRPRGSGRRLQSIYTVAKLINFFPIRQAVPAGLAWARFCSWARWARFFIEKKMYCSKYSISTYILLFSKCLRGREWVGSVWMTTSQLGKRLPLGLGFGAGLAELGFP